MPEPGALRVGGVVWQRAEAMNRRLRMGWGGMVVGLVMAAAVWAGSGSRRVPADWIELEGFGEAIAGERYGVRVRLREREGGEGGEGWLTVDLRGSTWRREPVGVLLGGATVRLEAGESEGVLAIPVEAKPGIVFGHLVAFVGREPGWTNRVRTAMSRRMALRSERGEGRAAAGRVPMFLPEKTEEVETEPSRALRWATAVAWFGAAGGLVRGARRGRGPCELGKRRMGLALGFGLLGFWEATHAGGWAGEAARGVFRAWGVYQWREGVLRLGSAVLVGLAAWCWVRWAGMRWPAWGRIAWGAGLVAVMLAGMGALSLHAFDQWVARAWAGVTLLQGAKLGTALVALVAVTGMERRKA
ncbi:MAG: hypothetical protein KF833_16270 [Verrucomicrobiae bacterium]|nr:hypothetical protein [Verrucomicrobiae bacterium]